MAPPAYGGVMFRPITRSQLLVDLVVAAVFALFGWLGVQRSDTGGFDLLVLLGFAAALALRRLSPGLALVVAWVAAILQMATSAIAPTVSDLAVLGVLYATAAYGGRIVRWVGLASAGVGAVMAAGYLVLLPQWTGGTSNSPDEVTRAYLTSFVGLLALLGLSWTLGQLARIYRRARDSRLAQVVAEQRVITEQERNRIARDMHDVVAHSLAVVIAQADGARYARVNDPEAVDAALTTISTTAREALGDVRVLLSQLRHSEGEAPQPALDDLDRLIEQLGDSGLTIERTSSGTAHPLPGGQQLAVYRIVQEALINALRHGDAGSPVALDFAWSESQLTVTVINLLRADAVQNPGGHGLAGVCERAQLAGGTVSAGPVDGNWVVEARLGLTA